MKQVLIVEDDDSIAAGLRLNLQIEGYDSVVAPDGEDALAKLSARRPDLVLLDISLPGKSGLIVLSEMRAAGDQTPVIVLSARHDEFDKVAALRLGADDYVTKPFALAELLARVHAVLRRAQSTASLGVVAPEPANEKWSFSGIVVELATHLVSRGGEMVKLTHLEFELLVHFLRNPARVFSRAELLRNVWALQSGSRRTVDNFMAQLRAKLESDPDAPRHFMTVRGSGYRFDP